MVRIETILCPVDVPHVSNRALALAKRLAQKFGARLVLQHDLTDRPPEFLATSWMYAEKAVPVTEAEASETEKTLGSLLVALKQDVSAEGRVTRGPRDAAILELAQRLPADLIVMATHGRNHPEHASLTERLLSESPCPVLATHLAPEGQDQPELLAWGAAGRLPAVVPIDFTEHSLAALGFAFELAETLHLDLHLVHVEGRLAWDDVKHSPEMSVSEHRRQRVWESRARLRELIPPALASWVACDVGVGPRVPEILGYAKNVGAELIVMGVHPKGLVDWLFTGATSCSVLRDASCPVWFVPAPGVRQSQTRPVESAALAS